MLGAMINRRLHNYATAARERAIDRIVLDRSPFTRRPPILRELAKSIVRIFLGMLLPVSVLEPYGVSAFEVLMSQRCKEFARFVPFRVVAQMVSHPRQDQGSDHDDNDQISATAAARLVVLLRIHERHVLSIMESGEEEKVPESCDS